MVIYAVGDYYNDIEMIERADVGIAVSNGVEKLREKATYITVDNEQGVIADIIDRLLQKQE